MSLRSGRSLPLGNHHDLQSSGTDDQGPPAFQLLGFTTHTSKRWGKRDGLAGALIGHGKIQGEENSRVDELGMRREPGFRIGVQLQTESWYPEKWGMKTHPFEDQRAKIFQKP